MVGEVVGWAAVVTEGLEEDLGAVAGCDSFTESQLEIVEELTGLRSVGVERPVIEQQSVPVSPVSAANPADATKMKTKAATSKKSGNKSRTPPPPPFSSSNTTAATTASESAHRKKRLKVAGPQKRIVALSGFEVRAANTCL